MKRFVCVALTSLVLMSAEYAGAEGADLFAPSWRAGKGMDAERALPLTPFYASPALQTPAPPGTLVRAEPATDYTLPPGVTATRILYHTRTADNTVAVACGRGSRAHRIVAFMDIFAHTSDNNVSEQAKQASGNLTPRD